MIEVKFITETDAFSGNPDIETARILRKIADQIEGIGDCYLMRPVRDTNGNRVGNFEYEPYVNE